MRCPPSRLHAPVDCGVFEASFAQLMKQYALTVSDKDIARWIETELRQLVPAFEGRSSSIGKPTTPST